MRRSIIRRVLQFIPVLLGITFLAFLLIYLSPSDPVSVRMSAGGISVSPEIMESMRRSMGLDRPLLIQYGDWLWNILHGNMGKSYITDADVLDQILKALPYTLKMAGASLLLTLCISIPVGILTAAMQNSKFDYVVRVMAFVGNALPNFIIALCLMFYFFLPSRVDSCAGDDKAYRPYPSCAYAGAGHVVPLYPADSCRYA